MKNKILFFVLINGSLISCKDATTEKEINPASAEIPLVEICISECYQYVINKDTIAMHLNDANDIVVGQLSYKLYGKDNSKGTFKGRFNKDILIVDYTFKAEGTTSIQQLAFKQEGDNLIQGYGEMEEKEGKLLFKDIKTLTFDTSTIVLKNIDCLE